MRIIILSIFIIFLSLFIAIYFSAQFLPIVLGSAVESSSVGVPATNFNMSKTIRIAVVGDVDSNQGLTTELEIANHYNVQALILTGDFEYSNGNKVLSDLQSHGFTKANTDIVVGNHDSEQDVEAWLNEKVTFGQVNFAFAADRLALFNIDANSRFDCSSPQFEDLKSQIESSKALYKFVVIHQPFVTVKVSIQIMDNLVVMILCLEQEELMEYCKRIIITIRDST